MIFNAIRHNLANLFRFSGRDTPGQFWPYAILIVIADFVWMWALMVPILTDSLARMQRFAAEHPESATVESGPGQYSITIQGYHPELMPDLAPVMVGIAAMAAITVLLLAAAVARRLHDRGRSGLIGLLPLPFLAYACVVMQRFFASASPDGPDMLLFLSLFINNLLYLAVLLFLIVQLAGRGTLGANRFGEDPRNMVG